MKKFLFINKSILDVETFIRCKRINNVLSHNVELVLILFNIKRKFTIFEHVFVNMSNAKKLENLKKCYIKNIHKRFIAIINNNLKIF